MTGTWCLLPSPEVIDILSRAYGFLIIDREHGIMDDVTMQRMIMAAGGQSEVWVRAAQNNESEILHILDSGADGIIMPHINTVEEAEKFISYTKFPPEGKRGYSPYVRSSGYRVEEGYREKQNRGLLRGIILESLEALSNIHELLKLDIDLFYIGVYDLSLDMGHAIGSEKMNVVVSAAMSHICAAGKDTGMMYHTEAEKTLLEEYGIKYLVYKTDTALLQEGAQGSRFL